MTRRLREYLDEAEAAGACAQSLHIIEGSCNTVGEAVEYLGVDERWWALTYMEAIPPSVQLRIARRIDCSMDAVDVLLERRRRGWPTSPAVQACLVRNLCRSTTRCKAVDAKMLLRTRGLLTPDQRARLKEVATG